MVGKTGEVWVGDLDLGVSGNQVEKEDKAITPGGQSCNPSNHCPLNQGW